MKEKMTIHQALSTLKLLEKKISSKLNGEFIGVKVVNAEKTNGIPTTDYEKDLKSRYDSVQALIKNNAKIKAAIDASNATTIVTIGGKSMTVQEAIVRKHLIETDMRLLANLKSQYEYARKTVNNENDKLPAAAERYVTAVLSADKAGKKPEEIEAMKNEYIAKNTRELADPNNLKEEIDRLESDILEFQSNVDYKLSESNSTTVIEVDLDDVE
jgi:hypothetical protein